MSSIKIEDVNKALIELNKYEGTAVKFNYVLIETKLDDEPCFQVLKHYELDDSKRVAHTGTLEECYDFVNLKLAGYIS
jgi:hypothetical protein